MAIMYPNCDGVKHRRFGALSTWQKETFFQWHMKWDL